MKNKLSHSALNKYQTCPKSYEYHYIHKIRSKYHSAALAFGAAMDEALNALLKGDNNAEEVFVKAFTNTKINDVDVYLPTCDILVYSNNDFDIDLLTKEDSDLLELTYGNSDNSAVQLLQEARNKKAKLGFDKLSSAEKQLFNHAHWLCLNNKAKYMLKAYREKVLPRIEKVVAVQKMVSLSNSDGDSVIGYVDLIADIKGVGRVILDNKTSNMEYDEDSVLTSPQLSLYVHMLEEEHNTRKAGYIVMRKTLNKNKKKICRKCGNDGSGKTHKTCDALSDGKRCHGEWEETIDPDVHIQFLIDEIPKKTEEIVIDNFDGTNQAIKAGVFTRNFNSCHNSYGSRCVYFDLCYRGNMHQLVKKE